MNKLLSVKWHLFRKSSESEKNILEEIQEVDSGQFAH